MREICLVAGPGCLLAFVFLSIASRAFLPDFDFAFANQLPLTATNDIGLTLGIATCMLALPRIANEAKGYAFALAAMGTCLATLTKIGVIGEMSPITLAAGDALSSFFATTCLILWWQTILEESDRPSPKAIARVGLAGAALFFPFALLPTSIAGIVASIVLPLASCLCFAPFIGTGPQNDNTAPTEPSRQPMPGIVAVIAVLSFFTVDPILDLFPTNLFFDGAATGSLCLPGALAIGACAAMSAALLGFGRKHDTPLAALYVPAFALAAIGFLLSPYRPANGIPLGCAEAGRILACAFMMCVVLRTSDNAREGFALSLRAALLAGTTVIACDVVIIALQLMPEFNNSDFVFRTTFSIVNIAALVTLLLGPLPRLELALSAMDSNRTRNEAPASTQPIADPAAQRDQLAARFAQKYGLTARETEVLALIAAGRDVPYIERELVLAKSTVKTHVKHIYAKCGVSSKQDLLDMLEAFSE